MDFVKYSKLCSEISDEFNDEIASFPLSFSVLESELRNELVGDTKQSQKNNKRLSKNYLLINTLAELIKYKKFTKNSIYIELPGFHELNKLLVSELNIKYNIFSKKGKVYKNRNKILHKIGTKGRIFPQTMLHASRHGVQATLKNRDIISKLEVQLRRNVDDQKKFIKNNGIKGFISSNESKPFARVLIQSANELGLPYITISHGYISNPYLITVAPIKSSKLVVWSDTQARDLKIILPDRVNDIISFGNPKLIRNVSNKNFSKNILLPWEPLFIDLDEETCSAHLEILNLIGNLAKSFKKNVYFKPHPKELRDNSLRVLVESFGLKWEDRVNCYDIFPNVGMVISSNSSVLFEAASYGLLSIQISELKTSDFEGSIILSKSKISSLFKDETYLELLGKSKGVMSSFDKNAFISWLQDYLAD